MDNIPAQDHSHQSDHTRKIPHYGQGALTT